MGLETAAMIGAIASLAGAATTAISASKQPKQKSPAGVPQSNAPGPDEAKAKLEEEEQLRQRRGRASTLLQGESGVANVATTQSGGKTLLGA